MPRPESRILDTIDKPSVRTITVDKKTQLKEEAKGLRSSNADIRKLIRETKANIRPLATELKKLEKDLARNMKRLERIKELQAK